MPSTKTFTTPRRGSAAAALALGTAALVLTSPAGPAAADTVSVPRATVNKSIPLPVNTNGVWVKVEAPNLRPREVMVTGSWKRTLNLTLDAQTATSLVTTNGSRAAGCTRINKVLTFTVARSSALTKAWATWQDRDARTGKLGPVQTRVLLNQQRSATVAPGAYKISICG